MSQSSFTTFLDRLAKQLGTSPERCDDIVDELQDHYEDRIADLLADGWDRSAAESKAMREFGSVVQLADNYRSVFRIRRRRMAMKMTAGTIGLATVVAMVLMFGGPSRQPVKMAVAQKTKAKAGAFADDGGGGGGKSAQNRRKKQLRREQPQPARKKAAGAEIAIEDNNLLTQRKLAQRIPVDFIDTPLTEVLDYLADVTKVQFYVNLTKDDTKKTKPITLSLKKVRVDMALELSLQQAGGFAYAVRDGIVMVSSGQELKKATVVRIYNCRDLLRWTPAGYKARSRRRFRPAGGAPAGAGGGGGGAGGAGGTGSAGPGGGIAAGAGQGAFGGAGGGIGGAGGGAGRRMRSGGAGAGGMTAGGAMGGAPMGGAPRRRQTTAKDSLRRLQDVLQNAVAPEDWAENGGFGTMAEFDGLLIINHNVQAHRKIERVLEMLRKALEKAGQQNKPAKGKGFYIPMRKR